MRKSEDILQEVLQHYDDWTEDNDQRRQRDGGWDDVIDAYNNVLPTSWPYLSKVVDPRIRTTLLEKKGRLTNAKLQGRLIPREGGDVLKSKINNAVLDYQWDSANYGGTMNAKFGEMDMDSRMFGSSFAYVHWCYVKDDDKVIKNGNELKVLDPNNSGIDPNCTNIRDAKWFQMREYVTLDQLEEENSFPEAPKYTGLSELEESLSNTNQNTRESDYQVRTLTLRGLQDRLGRDDAYPVVEVVTEFRPDRWITFSPKYNIILRDIKNPYKHRSIPIIQLKYYPLLNDPWGESEVECVLPLWRAIQATINGYIDSMNLHMNPPIKVVEGQVRMETLIWGPQATWIMNRLDAVQEHAGTGEALRYFQQTYTSLVAAFNQAMGDLSQGVSRIDPFNNEKTATEVKATLQQQNVRDQNNQLYLADCINDMMRMWLSNNQQFLFADPDMNKYVLRIIGRDMFNYFQRSGLDQMTVPDESMMKIRELIDLKPDMGEDEMKQLFEAAKVPLHPVDETPNVKDEEKKEYSAKLKVNDMGDAAELAVVPEDLEGMYDYEADVQSMALGAANDQLKVLNNALTMLTSPVIMQLLQNEGVRPNVKEITESIFSFSGLKDTDRYYSPITAAPGVPANMGQPGLPNLPTPTPQGGEQMVGPSPVQVPGGAEPSLSPGLGSGAGLQGIG